MPDFAAETLSGETVTAREYVEGATAFIFISKHCTPCREHMPSFIALGPKAQASGVQLVLVSTDDAEQTQTFVRELNIDLPVLVAPEKDNPFAKDYGVVGTPYHCIVKDGVIYSTGLLGEGWEALIEQWEANSVGPGYDSTVSLSPRSEKGGD
jgi:peroxiredoxin